MNFHRSFFDGIPRMVLERTFLIPADLLFSIPIWSFLSLFYLDFSSLFLFEIPSPFYIRLRFKMNRTTFWVGHFTAISCHCLANYIINFHKIKVLRNSLSCQTCLKLNLIKGNNIKHFLPPTWKSFTNLRSRWSFWGFYI